MDEHELCRALNDVIVSFYAVSAINSEVSVEYGNNAGLCLILGRRYRIDLFFVRLGAVFRLAARLVSSTFSDQYT